MRADGVKRSRRLRRVLQRTTAVVVITGPLGYAFAGGQWLRFAVPAAASAVIVAAIDLRYGREPRNGIGELTEAEQAALTAVRRGRPVPPELAPDFLKYCRTTHEEARRLRWAVRAGGAFYCGVFALLGVPATVLLLRHTGQDTARALVLITLGCVMIWNLLRGWRLSRKINRAERLVQASLGDLTVGQVEKGFYS
jgi:hypothetical protein